MRAVPVFVSAVVAALAVAAPASPGQERASSSVTVRPSRFGKILFDGRGFVLYAFTRDGRKRSRCTGECASAWPPYVVKGRVAARSGASAKLLGTTLRADGSTQVTYAGRPLYYYVGDRSPGEIRCQNVLEYGGLWLVVRADGRLVR